MSSGRYQPVNDADAEPIDMQGLSPQGQQLHSPDTPVPSAQPRRPSVPVIRKPVSPGAPHARGDGIAESPTATDTRWAAPLPEDADADAAYESEYPPDRKYSLSQQHLLSQPHLAQQPHLAGSPTDASKPRMQTRYSIVPATGRKGLGHNYRPAKQFWMLARRLMARWFINLLLCAMIYLLLVLTVKEDILWTRGKRIYNGIFIGITLFLGMNIVVSGRRVPRCVGADADLDRMHSRAWPKCSNGGLWPAADIPIKIPL